MCPYHYFCLNVHETMRYATLRYGTAEMENDLNLFFRIISSKYFELSTRSNEEETAPKPKVINQASVSLILRC